ncbi:pentapeptide repeat-containing protein [Halorussus lipolyticus]|uniref:pentapeptide repeat-containing protein n=1 Tax=Halorussus lipolyticus TaxID=3034024 RepID=UPI0023E89A2F|nr:pentapeptide repeat-containing protein [Halorussus sp. DT80]
MSDTPTGAEAGSIPNGVPKDRCGYTLDTDDVPEIIDAVSCWRPVWNDSEQCIWHADVENKPITELRKACSDQIEQLDGAILRSIEAEGFDWLSGCRLIRADLTEAHFPDADLSNADLFGADFTEADLSGANLANAYLPEADFTKASLRKTKLIDASLDDAILTDADLYRANLADAILPKADFTNARLQEANLIGAVPREADFTNASLPGAYFTNADLSQANLINTYLHRANLISANLDGADLTGADLREANLRHTTLAEARLTETKITNADAKYAEFERATLTRTDFFDANLIGARFYGATFDDTKINRGTEFGEHYADDLDGIDGEDLDDEEATPWDKAAWTYRQLEELARRNALPEQAREAFKRRKDIRRDELWQKLWNDRDWGSFRNWGYSKGLSVVMRYGASPWRVVRVSGGVIGIWSVLYLLLGSIYVPEGFPDSETIGQNFFPVLSLPTPLTEWGISLYFSVVTFTTLGYGDLQPASGAAQALATIESFLGALLIALLVFVLGRRSTW